MNCISASTPTYSSLLLCIMVLIGCGDPKVATQDNLKKVLEPQIAKMMICDEIDLIDEKKAISAIETTQKNVGFFRNSDQKGDRFDEWKERASKGETFGYGVPMVNRLGFGRGATSLSSNNPLLTTNNAIGFDRSNTSHLWVYALSSSAMTSYKKKQLTLSWELVSGICSASLRLSKIENWTEPADANGKKKTTVYYYVEVADVENWAKPFFIEKVKDGVAQRKREVDMILMSDGWKVDKNIN